MNKDSLMIKFVGILQERYPDVIFRFEYQEEDDWYKIWHTYEKVNEDDEFRGTIGRYMKDILFPESMMKVYFDLNIDFIEGMKRQSSWHVASTKEPSVKEVLTQLISEAIDDLHFAKNDIWNNKSDKCQKNDDTAFYYPDAA